MLDLFHFILPLLKINLFGDFPTPGKGLRPLHSFCLNEAGSYRYRV